MPLIPVLKLFCIPLQCSTYTQFQFEFGVKIDSYRHFLLPSFTKAISSIKSLNFLRLGFKTFCSYIMFIKQVLLSTFNYFVFFFSPIQYTIKGGQSLQNREKRFTKFISSSPGPGSYDQSCTGTLGITKRKVLKAKAHVQSVRYNFKVFF